MQYNPYPGIVLTPDSNGRCDIYGPAPVGHSTITATSVYPDQPVLWDGGNKTSNALAKTVNYASSKVLNCVAKSRNEAFCVETILDPQGNPVQGARVQFSAQAFQGSAPVIGSDAAKVPPYDTTTQTDWGTSDARLRERDDGRERPGRDLRAQHDRQLHRRRVGERRHPQRWRRHLPFDRLQPDHAVLRAVARRLRRSNTGGATGTTGGTTAGGATAPVVTAAPVAVSTPVPTARTAPTGAAKTMSLATARVVKVGTGRYLMVRVNGPAKSAKLKITLISKINGKVTSRVVTRFVATNHQVRVGNLKLAPSIRSVRVALA